MAQGTTNCANRTHWSQPRNAHQRPSRARSGALPGRESGGVEIDLGPCPAAEFGIARPSTFLRSVVALRSGPSENQHKPTAFRYG